MLGPTLLLATAVVLPGTVVLRLLGVRGVLALGGGPAVSVAVYAVLAIVANLAGIAWAWPPVLAGWVLVAVVAAVLGRWARGCLGALAEPSPRGRTASLLALTFVVAAALLAVPIAVGMGSPGALHQHWDSVFHANGVQAIRDTGNASTLGAMAPLFGDIGPRFYYPAAWHGLVALVPASVAVAANASTFVLGVLAWLLGMGALGRVVLRTWTGAGLTLVVAAGFGAFPAVILATLAQWPFGAAIALVPGALALLIAGTRGAHGRGRVVAVLAVAVAVGGVVLAHGSGLFSFLLVAGPYVVVAAVRWGRTQWSGGRRRAVLALAVGSGLVLLAALVVVLTSPTVQNMLRFERNVNAFYPVTAYRTLTDLPLAVPFVGNLPIAALTILGVLAVLRSPARREQLRWLVVAWGVVIAMVALAAGPENPLRMLAGFWYTQSARIAAVYPVVAAPLGALGLLAAAAWLRARLREGRLPRLAPLGARPLPTVAALLAGIVVVATAGWYAPAKAGRFAEAYEPGRIAWGTMLSEEEIALVRRLETTTPPDSVILGDPHNGAPFAYSVAHRRAALPQLGTSGMSESQAVLADRFFALGEDPAVCDAVRDLGVTHFYLDTATVADGAKVSPSAPGLQRLPATGVEEVDSGGTATLYRVTGCGQG
ncbi:hypothetical protein GCM10011331_25710 [Flavimobilis marinus]|uniref:4-amino-4-deoxy-L-arabinose transferase n=2 Tax=Flavimobilis marinus TaxID=285351 RepID=A0A1I2HIL0_9MICO|nr:hypothetical protein GCM10011331_25710 [Flavimobilis marinus]SFF28727.1 hypothetical protein SAMN04488035_2322 [Flavimobilis marinus]